MIQGEINITVKNDEKLMLQALSSFYPYDVILHFDDLCDEDDQVLYSLRENGGMVLVNDAYYLLEVKPYLRPLDSMTEEEVKELLTASNFCPVNEDIYNGFIHIMERSLLDIADIATFINWLCTNHFDFLGLIPKGLAIEVTDENNPYKN